MNDLHQSLSEIVGYADQRVKQLLSKGSAEQVHWFWAMVRALRERWPSADHYAVNTNPPDVRIGIKGKGKDRTNGEVAFRIRWSAVSGFICDVRDLKSHFALLKAQGRMAQGEVPEQISSSAQPEQTQIRDWLEALMRVIPEKILPLKGEGQMPSAYTDNELKSESPLADDKTNATRPALNRILFGPPGTGKTYATVDAALQVLDQAYVNEHINDRTALKKRFDELVQQDRIRFVTFHQSFSYEDFVEGLRATTDDAGGQLRYEVVDGVFKSLCEAAAVKVTQQAEAPTDLGQRRIWKMSLGNTLGEDASIYQECLEGGYVLLGYGGAIDFAGCTNRQEVRARFAEAGVVPENPATDYGITSVTAFVSKMNVGDLIVVSDGNFKFRAIGEVTGDYQFKSHGEFDVDYSQMRPVKWLRQYQPSLPHTELLNGQFSQMTLYELRSSTLDKNKLRTLLGSSPVSEIFVPGQVFGRDYQVVRATSELLELKKPNGNLLPFSMSLLRELADGVNLGVISLQDIRDKTAIEKLPESTLEPYLVNGYNSILAPLVEHFLAKSKDTAPTSSGSEPRVLIIDEINRGNISRIFGELITLIEPSKRSGANEALSVVLPYSKQTFSVPDNLYLIGTMNTADRSLAGLDMALRRRFVFQEMPPRPELLDDVEVAGVKIGELLNVMNQRIEVLLDRDHCLGHAYFLPLKSDSSLERLGIIFRNQIVPLLQEYFFEDWQRIAWVLNDHRKAISDQFIQQRTSLAETLFGQDVGQGLTESNWTLNEDAFERLESYLGILDVSLTVHAQTVKREVVYGEITLRELASGTIELHRGGILQQPVSPILRELAEQLDIGWYNSNGNPLNTRNLGRSLINRLAPGAE